MQLDIGYEPTFRCPDELGQTQIQPLHRIWLQAGNIPRQIMKVLELTLHIGQYIFFIQEVISLANGLGEKNDRVKESMLKLVTTK